MGQSTLWLCCARILCLECNLWLLFCKLFSITPSRPSPLRAGLRIHGSLYSHAQSRCPCLQHHSHHLRDAPSNAGPQCTQIFHYGESYLRDFGPEGTTYLSFSKVALKGPSFYYLPRPLVSPYLVGPSLFAQSGFHVPCIKWSCCHLSSQSPWSHETHTTQV